MCVPIGEEIEKKWIGSEKEKWTGIWRPFAESSELPNMLCIISTTSTP